MDIHWEKAAMKGRSVPKFRARAFESFVHGHVLDLQRVLERVFRQACERLAGDALDLAGLLVCAGEEEVCETRTQVANKLTTA